MTVESAQPEATEAASKPLEPELAGGALPALGHSWKMVRDPVGFLTRLRDHGDIVAFGCKAQQCLANAPGSARDQDSGRVGRSHACRLAAHERWDKRRHW